MAETTLAHLLTLLAAVALAGGDDAAAAQPSADPAGGAAEDDAADEEAAPVYEAVVVGEPADPTPALEDNRATSTVSREELDRRAARSAPDALRDEAGVFVQQTAHGQGSAFIRGLTGQQTLILFDGIRLNNSTFRQGPNQYFFTLDSQTLERIEVQRGGGSTRWGSDALGGVILAHPVTPAPLTDGDGRAFSFAPRLLSRLTTADREYGGRLEGQATLGDDLAFFGGAGLRRVGRLESGGLLRGLDGEPALVPRFATDGRTQRGTGFDELTADAQLAWRLSAHHRLRAASFLYRQLDAPRTDQCPAPFAPRDECLTYEEQFRTLAYLAWEATHLGAWAKTARATLSWQRQHERRRLRRPSAFTAHLGRDDVDTFGLAFAAESRAFRPADAVRLRLSWGGDLYLDRLASAAWILFTDLDFVERRSRGQYLDGSRYTTGGLFLELGAELGPRLTLRAGGRGGRASAAAPSDPASGSRAIDAGWWPWSGTLGLSWRALDALELLTNVDRSFRAPNLDDLTSRQQTGPGFQFENPLLEPEQALTLEVGARTHGIVRLELWAFVTRLDGAVGKSPREITDCPPDTPQCATAWTRFQLVNAEGAALVRGLEGMLSLTLPLELALRATGTTTWGEGPNLAERPSDPTVPYRRRVPLSRVPPTHGTVELLWGGPAGLSAAAALRWGLAQDRLAVSDRSDARIPPGGTPGFAVLDLRLGYRLDSALVATVVLENLFDAAYRYHGSSVNGPGRGATAWLALGW